MELTEYDKKTFSNLEKLKIDKWYDIPLEREDRSKLIESIKKYHECFGLIEFSKDYTGFRIVLRENVILPLVRSIERPQSNEMYSVDKETKEKNKSLKSKEKMSNFKEVPGICSRPDLVKEILDKEEAERKRNMYVDTRAEKQKKIKDWINGDNIHNV